VPTVADVRALLGDLDPSYVSDETIQKHIDEAANYVGQFVSSSHPLYEQAVLYRATYLTLLTYSEVARREVGDLPANVSVLLEHFRQLADETLAAARASQISTTYTPIALTRSWYDETESGDP